MWSEAVQRRGRAQNYENNPMQSRMGPGPQHFGRLRPGREMVRRHGLTPVQWLDRIGLLGSDLILAHAIFNGVVLIIVLTVDVPR